jgi:hypothetical protein
VEACNISSLFVIAYPRKSGKPVSIGMDILANILKESNAIISMDSSLSFLGKVDVGQATRHLKSVLQGLDIPFSYRVLQGSSSGASGILGQLLGFGKKQADRDIITFELPKDYFDYDLFDAILKLGCEVYVPFEPKTELVERVFNCQFKEDDEKYSTFKYVIYINDFLGQAALRTKALTTDDVKKLCKVNS